jgi:hypothetical protein
MSKNKEPINNNKIKKIYAKLVKKNIKYMSIQIGDKDEYEIFHKFDKLNQIFNFESSLVLEQQDIIDDLIESACDGLADNIEEVVKPVIITDWMRNSYKKINIIFFCFSTFFIGRF